jgi:hypothetical protein
MKKINLITIAASIFVTMFFACSHGVTTETLTVTEVVMSLAPSLTITEIKMVDEKGDAIPSFYTESLDKWFENTMIHKIIIPNETKYSYIYDNVSGSGYFTPEKDAKLLFQFKVNDSIYSIGVGNGSKFVVQKNKDGQYTLLPNETVALSPPPAVKE